jgi:anti-anti-sigma regulatory factor
VFMSPPASGPDRDDLPDARTRIAALESELRHLQQRLDHTLVLNRVIGAAASALDRDVVLRTTCRELALAYHVPQAAVALCDQAGEALVVSAEYCAPGRVSALGERIPVANNPITQYVLDQRVPMVCNDVRSDPRLGVIGDLLARRGTISLLIAPILIRNEVVGTIGLDAVEPRQFTADEVTLVQDVSIALSQVLDNARLYAAVQQELAERKRAEGIIQQQAITLAELSTPLIPITDRILVLPLIGTVDAPRAQQILETLLNGVAHHGADTVIIDITGTPVVDTHVANTLIGAARAVQLLGATAILTGIRPEVAQTLVGLGIDLRSMITHSTLQTSIAYAIRADQPSAFSRQPTGK